MTLRLFLLILASVGVSALAQLSLKIGTLAAANSKSASLGPTGIAREMAGLAQSPMVVVGLGLYGVGACLWLFVLGRAPLSLAYPFVGLGFILTTFAGVFYLHESVSVARVAGTLLIAIGCVVVARSA